MTKTIGSIEPLTSDGIVFGSDLGLNCIESSFLFSNTLVYFSDSIYVILAATVDLGKI